MKWFTALNAQEMKDFDVLILFLSVSLCSWLCSLYGTVAPGRIQDCL